VTEPTPDTGEQQGSGRRRAREDQPSAVKELDVVEYVHHDPILGGHRRHVGVVAAVDEQGAEVIPLTHHRVRVSRDELTPIGAGDDV
jgi:hypothetical protein